MQAGVYRYYQGGYYQVLGIAEHIETKEKMVVYIALTEAYKPGTVFRICGLKMFIGNVEEGVNSNQDPPIIRKRRRFEYVGSGIPDTVI